MKKIIFCGEHNEVLKHWLNYTGKPVSLIHIDAHPDLKCSYSYDFLKNKYSKRKNVKLMISQKTGIAEFICLAISTKIIKELNWVIPKWSKCPLQGSFLSSVGLKNNKIFLFIKKDKKIINFEDKKINYAGIKIIKQIPLHIMEIDKLSIIKNNYFLDIDLDYFSAKNPRKKIMFARHISSKKEIKTEIERLISKIKSLSKNPAIITITKSVKSGYVPLVLAKFIEKELVKKLKEIT